MAEGSVEEDNTEMLGPSGVPSIPLHISTAPTNLSIKDEDSDCSESSGSVGSPSPATDAASGGTDLSMCPQRPSSMPSSLQAFEDDHHHHHLMLHQEENKNSITNRPSSHNNNNNNNNNNNASAVQQQLNGTMASLATLQNLQNLASLHQTLPQVANLAANLSNIANLHNVHHSSGSMNNNNNLNISNGPLNLSVNAASAAAPLRSQPISSIPGDSQLNPMSTLNSQLAPTPSSSSSLPPQNPLLQSPQPASMPQLILASGQLVQGIQGAQLLIPTSQGLATQTILTIPVNHVNSTDQMVNLALNNGQVMQTSLANLQAMAAAHQIPTSNNNNNNNNNGASPQSLLNSTASLNHLLSSASTASNATQQLLQSLPQMISNQSPSSASSQQQQQQPISPLINSLTQPSLLNQSTAVAPLLSQSSPYVVNQHQPSGSIFSQAPPPPPPPSLLNNNPTTITPPASQTPPKFSLGNGGHHYGGENKSGTTFPSQIPRSCSSPIAGINGGRSSSAGASSDISVPTSLAIPNIKRSPSSLSPDCNDSSTADLLIDSPNQPTINQTNSNVVDGINLDEIKDFAKAFKLRRLSLGLTQTQVGQALSVTEGPAYSQSAICSALASQMVAAAQQQAMFEKLDITPKSAQKIKPVLERWMKEAEESYSRYKSGQNHLTDFIGIEPSKKRKRRTSFTPQALELLNAHFERNTHPSGTEITGLAHQLGYEREVIRIWFCNKRQALKNTVRMMSKGMV